MTKSNLRQPLLPKFRQHRRSVVALMVALLLTATVNTRLEAQSGLQTHALPPTQYKSTKTHSKSTVSNTVTSKTRQRTTPSFALNKTKLPEIDSACRAAAVSEGANNTGAKQEVVI